MVSRQSTQDSEGAVVATASIPLSKLGLDLRTPTGTDALRKLNNARFQDTDTIERRPGHTARLLRDNSLMAVTSGPVMPEKWVYGHGTKISDLVLSSYEDAHFPWHMQSKLTFRFRDNDVSWTGDRLLVHRPTDDRCTGRSTFWWRYSDVSTPALDYGIPCYAPTMDDTIYADIPGTNSADTCLSTTQQCIVWTTATKVFARVLDRSNGCTIDESEISGTTGAPGQIRVVTSGGNFVVLWTDIGDGNLHKNYYNGQWQTAAVEIATVPDWDLCARGFEGFFLVYRTGSTIKARCYSGVALQTGPFAADTVVPTTGTPSGAVAIAVAPDGTYGIAWQDTSPNVRCRTYTAAMVAISGVLNFVSGTATRGLTVTARGLRDINGRSQFTVYAGIVTAGIPAVNSGTFNNNSFQASQGLKPNCTIASHAFTVGNEAFVWLMSGNTALKFLIGGNLQPVVCGYADRGEAEAPQGSSYRLTGVAADPASALSFAWIRAKAAVPTGTPPSRRVVGYLNFLPDPCAVQYGESIYISGSAVQNFDGETVSDAGFQEYPLSSSNTQDTDATGHLTLTKNYSIRAYVVRRNARGEKFISQAKTSNTVLLTGTNNRIQWAIFGVQSCTDRSASIEIYRTIGDGSTYFYEQTIANDQTVASQLVFSTAADTTVAQNPADPYAPQLGGTPLLQSTGPTGCKVMIAHRDRLWLAGGQVLPGQVVFSKLKDVGFGAGFDDIAGSLIVDVEQRPVTSLAGHNEALVAFHRDRISLIQADGPDNYGRGNFPPAELVLAPGATTHRGTALTRVGIVYWSSGGPHVLSPSGQIANISAPVRSLAQTLTPSGVRVAVDRQDVVWYTAGGTALLWDYTEDNSRWAQWGGLPATSASETGISVADGRLFLANESVFDDGGVPYAFEGGTNWIHPEEIMAGHVVLYSLGFVGEWRGSHNLRMRTFYNGKSMWEEQDTWYPAKESWLSALTDPTPDDPDVTIGAITPAVVDTETWRTRGDGYSFHRRTKRGDCQRFRVEWSDINPAGDSFVPVQLIVSLGAKPGLGRQSISNFTSP